MEGYSLLIKLQKIFLIFLFLSAAPIVLQTFHFITLESKFSKLFFYIHISLGWCYFAFTFFYVIEHLKINLPKIKTNFMRVISGFFQLAIVLITILSGLLTFLYDIENGFIFKSIHRYSAIILIFSSLVHIVFMTSRD